MIGRETRVTLGSGSAKTTGCDIGIPAIQARFSRSRGTVQQGPVQRQETQIVQSCKTLDDFLPGFGLPTIRWSDIDIEGREVRWRAEYEKTGYEHVTPLTDEAVAALEEARKMGAGTRNAPVLPASRDATRCTALVLVRQGSWFTYLR